MDGGPCISTERHDLPHRKAGGFAPGEEVELFSVVEVWQGLTMTPEFSTWQVPGTPELTFCSLDRLLGPTAHVKAQPGNIATILHDSRRNGLES